MQTSTCDFFHFFYFNDEVNVYEETFELWLMRDVMSLSEEKNRRIWWILIAPVENLLRAVISRMNTQTNHTHTDSNRSRIKVRKKGTEWQWAWSFWIRITRLRSPSIRFGPGIHTSIPNPWLGCRVSLIFSLPFIKVRHEFLILVHLLCWIPFSLPCFYEGSGGSLVSVMEKSWSIKTWVLVSPRRRNLNATYAQFSPVY